MWHTKQDLLHKAYHVLYRKESAAEKGTLYYFKVLLRRSDVNGNVKSNFKAHWDLFMTVGEHFVTEQAMEYFGMPTPVSIPTKNPPPEGITAESAEVRLAAAKHIIVGLLRHHGYGNFSLQQPTATCQQEHPSIRTTYQVLGVTEDGKVLVVPVEETIVQKPLAHDKIYNYASNYCHWFLQLLMLDDTAKEGDIDRLVINCKTNLPFFFSHSHLSKYFVENMDFVLKTRHLLSPAMSLRVLEGSFVNVKGGSGNNVEADLAQEHSVRNRKDLVRQLGANKTEKAIKRMTNAADGIALMAQEFDRVVGVFSSGSRHAKHTSDADRQKVTVALREVQPFNIQPGRQCRGFQTICKSPYDHIDRQVLTTYLTRNIRRICIGQTIQVEEDSEDEEAAEDGLPNL